MWCAHLLQHFGAQVALEAGGLLAKALQGCEHIRHPRGYCDICCHSDQGMNALLDITAGIDLQPEGEHIRHQRGYCDIYRHNDQGMNALDTAAGI